MSQDDEYAKADPPKPPPFDRRISIPPGHATGLLLLALLPLLAVFGVFGGDDRTVEKSGDGVALGVTYAPRMRFGYPVKLQIHVGSVDDRPLSGAEVHVSTSFLERFDRVSSMPEPKRMSREACEFAVDDGQREAVIAIDLEPERYGFATGTVSVVAQGGVAVELPIRSFVLP
ncbi:MAG TPA: hypothetical protein VGD81_21040 [Opitutaceae bacterium]